MISNNSNKIIIDQIMELNINNQKQVIVYVEQIDNRLIINLIDAKNAGKDVKIAKNRMDINNVDKNKIRKMVVNANIKKWKQQLANIENIYQEFKRD